MLFSSLKLITFILIFIINKCPSFILPVAHTFLLFGGTSQVTKPSQSCIFPQGQTLWKPYLCCLCKITLGLCALTISFGFPFEYCFVVTFHSSAWCHFPLTPLQHLDCSQQSVSPLYYLCSLWAGQCQCLTFRLLMTIHTRGRGWRSEHQLEGAQMFYFLRVLRGNPQRRPSGPEPGPRRCHGDARAAERP